MGGVGDLDGDLGGDFAGGECGCAVSPIVAGRTFETSALLSRLRADGFADVGAVTGLRLCRVLFRHGCEGKKMERRRGASVRAGTIGARSRFFRRGRWPVAAARQGLQHSGGPGVCRSSPRPNGSV